MALRTLVTGSDMCTGSDGAGPSNAVGALVNQLLGGAGKTQEQLRDLPAQVGPVLPPHAPLTPEGAAAAAAAAGTQVPGLAGPSSSLAHLDAFFPAARPHAVPDMVAEFERQQQQQQQQGLPPGVLPPGEPPLGMHPGAGPPPMLAASLKAFLSGHAPGPPALAAGGPPLSLPDAVRLRDRATILARQMHAGAPPEVADQQVAALLASLAIDPASLPAELPHQAAPPEWSALWEARAAGGRPPEPQVAADMAAAWREQQQLQQQRPQSTGWADEYAVAQHAQHAQQQQQQPPGGWAEEFQAASGPQGWASEFESQQAAAAAAPGMSAAAAADARATSARLVDVLSSDADPKMRNSRFLQFLSKMSKGELLFEDNKVVERPAGQGWADEFGGAAAAAAAAAAGPASSWSAEFQQQQQQQDGAQAAGPPRQRDWADEFAAGVADINLDDAATDEQLEAAWAAMGAAAAGGASSWAGEFAADADDAAAQADWDALYGQHATAAAAGVAASRGEYVFASPNPFLGDAGALEKGRDLFKRGLLSEAALALEAEVQAHPDNAPAWRLLGTVHAENDDDRQAIAALAKALAADPSSPEVLLALGVSHTNELDAGEALSYLTRWLACHPTYASAAAAAPPPPDSSQALGAASRLFESLAGPQGAGQGDAELQLALGVLHHLGRRYDAAIAAFQRALELRPSDYSLWNKLGATLANHSHSSEAVSAYRRALELKPNYMRAWTNMGISYANLGEYEASAAYYVRALGLNPDAGHVWGYLKTSLACAARPELIDAAEARDLGALTAALPL